MGETLTVWEYFVAPLLEHNPGEILDAFGQDGWEQFWQLRTSGISGILRRSCFWSRSDRGRFKRSHW